MTDVQPMGSTATMARDPAERITQHFLDNPSELIDARRRIRYFRASVDHFRHAFSRLHPLTPCEREKAIR
ncbi:MAG TPA: hypothetical protein VKK81_23125 [Candidatus Binatia bacterium]|nr:hypothetical protein [Candidatus Binatia bacterium]